MAGTLTVKLARVVLALTAAVPALAAGVPAAAAPPPPDPRHDTLSWSPCRSAVEGWDPKDTRTECTTVRVPLDYAHPHGRQTALAVTRIRASAPERRRGVVLFNPGGPGNSGADMPANMLRTSVAGIGVDHDLIGFDPRGTGLSGGKECDPAPEDGPDPDPKASPEEQFRQGYRQSARQNVRCTGYDPDFVRNLSTDVVARDMDRIRVALGERKIGYYGISWGTALGAVYRSRYDDHVDRMLLDSVMPPDFSMRTMNDGQVAAAEREFAGFARWAAARDSRYGLGRTGRAVEDRVVALARRLDAHPRTVTPRGGGDPVRFDGGRLRTVMTYPRDQWAAMADTAVALRDGGDPPLTGDGGEAAGLGYRDSTTAGLLMQRSVLCNDGGAEPDVATLWRQERRRRAASPLFSWEAGYQHWCAGWPLPAQPWHLRAGSSPLLLVGHRHETVTPYGWARAMRRRTGGSLLTVDNSEHGSLDITRCGARAVTFFRTGHPAGGSCPGTPM